RGLVVCLLAIALSGCRAQPPSPDKEASKAYRAAWTKRVQGDEAGYHAGLSEIAARYPSSRAGRRARQVLSQKDGETDGLTPLLGLINALGTAFDSQSAGPNK